MTAAIVQAVRVSLFSAAYTFPSVQYTSSGTFKRLLIDRKFDTLPYGLAIVASVVFRSA